MKLYEGGWYQAAQIYRPWALKQSWVTNRPKDNPLKDIDLWFWNRGLIKDVLPPVEQVKKDCPEAKLALDWYWWHTNPYDTDYPFFWPPREGEEAFRAAVKRMTDQGVYTQVYVNGVCWDCDADTWRETCGWFAMGPCLQQIQQPPSGMDVRRSAEASRQDFRIARPSA